MRKNKTTNVIFILGVILVIVIIGALVAVKTIMVSNENMNNPSSRYQTIMNFDFVNNYPTTPNEVMDDYCYIMSYLYSSEIKDEEIDSVVEKSRELLHFKVLDINSLESQISQTRKERETIIATNSLVTNVTHSKVLIDTQFPNYATCNVTEYTTSGQNLLGEYTLQMDNYQWKVYSWTLKGTSTGNGK